MKLLATSVLMTPPSVDSVISELDVCGFACFIREDISQVTLSWHKLKGGCYRKG